MSGIKIKSIKIGDSSDFYKGYRNSKWLKLDPNEYKSVLGKIYETTIKL